MVGHGLQGKATEKGTHAAFWVLGHAGEVGFVLLGERASLYLSKIIGSIGSYNVLGVARQTFDLKWVCQESVMVSLYTKLPSQDVARLEISPTHSFRKHK